MPKDNFQRGNFDRYVKKPRFVGQVIDYTERDWAIVLDGRGNFHLKTDEIVDKKDHIDIISLSPYGDVNRWEVKDAKKLFRSDSESQSRLILFEYETVADRNGITYLGWGRGKADKLVQRLDISQWLIVPISFVKLMLNRVDWTKVYLKPDPRSSRDVKTEICYTRDFDPRRGHKPIKMADGKIREVRGDLVALFDLSFLLTFEEVRIMKDGKLLPPFTPYKGV